MAAMKLIRASWPTSDVGQPAGHTAPPHLGTTCLCVWRFALTLWLWPGLWAQAAPVPTTGGSCDTLIADVQFSADGLDLYAATGDGWLARYDRSGQRPTDRYQVGAPVTAMAVSGDGNWVALATEAPPILWLFDRNLRLQARHPSRTLDGGRASRISSITSNRLRSSFIVSQRDIPELWEVSHDVRAEPIHDGYVHDYRMGESIAKPGFLGIRRIPLEVPLDVLLIDASGRNVLAAPYRDGGGGPQAPPGNQVINLDIRRKIADLPTDGAPAMDATTAHMVREIPH